MKYKLSIQFLTATITFSTGLFFDTCIAFTSAHKEISIDQSSIKWDDVTNRNKLLAVAPVWSNSEINTYFDAYKHPERYQLPKLTNALQFNIQFINAFWGPINNPFSSTSRPAKAFIFLNNLNSHSPAHYVMAPVIKNASDNNYYIFDAKQAKPMLLQDWVTNIQYEQNHTYSLRFNVCHAYGSLPSDSCVGNSYQAETRTAITKSRQSPLLAQVDLTIKHPNAHREFTEDWKLKANQLHRSKRYKSGNIYEESIAWNDITARNTLLSSVVSWPNFKTIQTNFEKIRDIRYFNDTVEPDFKRRISWLYPDDGCWTRASAMIKDLFGPFNNLNNSYPRPSKVFAFGNLCANTSNSPEGAVAWWYHTAPIVKDAETNQTYVLDPSVNPKKPLTMEKWAEEIASHNGVCARVNASLDEFNICNGYGAGPDDDCQSNYFNETNTILAQPSFQMNERDRQEELGRDANSVLGDLPPWLNS